MKRAIRKFLRKILGLPYEPSMQELIKRGLKIGSNFKMLEHCIIDESHCWHIRIGNNVTLAPRVHILAHDASTKHYLNYTKVKNVLIGNNVFIGAGSIILPGVKIGDNSIIGAGSVVCSDIPGNTVAAGNPARNICPTESYLNRIKSQMNAENCFGEDFTLRGDIGGPKKQHMFSVAETKGVAFVI